MESEPDPSETTALLRRATTIVAAYLRSHDVAPGAVAGLLSLVHSAVAGLGEAAIAPSTRVNVKRSITDDYLVCLEDGRKLKSLRRHIWSAYGLSPDAYRKKWGLPDDYPMVAPGYSRARSALAKATGLGRAGGAKPLQRGGDGTTKV